MNIKRTVLQTILKEMDSKEFISIVGPRQAGKTTLLGLIKDELQLTLKEGNSQIILETFQDRLLIQEFEENPIGFINRRKHATYRTYFFLDEFQLIKNAGVSLKLIYDTIDNIKIIFTGSSSLEIRSIGSEMVGRILQYQLNTLSLEEILSTQSTYLQKTFLEYSTILDSFLEDKDLGLDKIVNIPPKFADEMKHEINNIIKFGSYPAVYLQPNLDKKTTRLANIYSTYVEKDILNLLQIKKTDKYLNLVKYLSLSIGNIFVKSNVQKDLNLYYEEVEQFIDSLEQTFIIKKIKPFFTNKIKELKKSPLYYFNDLGLRNWAIQDFGSLEDRPDAGYVLENYVLRRLHERKDYLNNQESIKYWRKTSGAEVDFVIETPREIYPIEVKYKSFQKPSITKSFYSFLDSYQPKKAVFITKNLLAIEEFGDSKVLFLPYFIL